MFEFLLFSTLFFLVFWHQQEINKLKREISFLQQKNPEAEVKASSILKNNSEKNTEQESTFPQDAAHVYQQDLRAELGIQEEFIKPKPYNPESPIEKLIVKAAVSIKNYFTTGNIIVRIGGAILFFGLAFLAKYAAQHSTMSMDMRLLSIAFTAIALTGLGWRLRKREGHYGLILQGIGVAVFYLIVFSAAKLYLIIPLSVAFSLMLCIVVIGVFLSIKQNSLALVLFSITGGFLTPILTSDGTGSHVMLFGYYALLNLGIFLIAWHRSWKLLNLTGFIFTFTISIAWGVLRYDPQNIISCELFLILFYFFYLIISILFSSKESLSHRISIDSSLVFGLPIVAFSIQVELVHHITYVVAWSAFALGSLYISLYFLLSSKLQLLSKSFFAIGVVFYTITIPYAFSSDLTGALWALEGVAMVFIALHQKRNLTRYAGEALLVVATITYMISFYSHSAVNSAFLNINYLGCIFILASNLLCAYLLDTHKALLSIHEKNNIMFFALVSMAVWFFAGLHNGQMLHDNINNIMLLYIAISGVVFTAIALYFQWYTLRVLLQWYFVLGMLFVISSIEGYIISHPFAGIGAIALIGFFAVHYALLYLFEKDWLAQDKYHIVSMWAIALILALEGSYYVSLQTHYESWKLSIWMIIISLFTLPLLTQKQFLPQRFELHYNLYRGAGLNGLMAIILIAVLYSFNLDGLTQFGYIPLLNPIDLVTSGIFFLFYMWHTQQKHEMKYKLAVLLGGIFLLFLSVMLARYIHALLGVEYFIRFLLENKTFQMSLSILWTLVAVGVIAIARKKQSYFIWIAGASLIGVVVAKLFVVELSNSGSIERIVSFLVVGTLLLLIGYFAPLPPKNKQIDML